MENGGKQKVDQLNGEKRVVLNAHSRYKSLSNKSVNFAVKRKREREDENSTWTSSSNFECEWSLIKFCALYAVLYLYNIT